MKSWNMKLFLIIDFTEQWKMENEEWKLFSFFVLTAASINLIEQF